MMLDFAERYAKLAALLGFLFAVFQYYDTGRAARVERSIDYFEIYQDKTQSAKNEIDTMYREYQANVGDLTSQSETDEVFYAVQLNHTLHFEKIASYMDGLRVCVLSRACDKATARALMRSEARLAYLAFKQFVDAALERDPSYAKGVRCFAEIAQGRGCWTREGPFSGSPRRANPISF